MVDSNNIEVIRENIRELAARPSGKDYDEEIEKINEDINALSGEVVDLGTDVSEIANEISAINTNLSNCCIDVTDKFSTSKTCWFNAIYNPISRTITINISVNSEEGIANGDLAIIPPDAYKPKTVNHYLGCAGNARSNSNIYVAILLLVNANNIISVLYSQAITANQLGLSFTYEIA